MPRRPLDRSRLALAALAMAGATACAGALRHPTAEDARAVSSDWPDTSAQDLVRGRAVYVRRCSGCHTLVLPAAYPAKAWPSLVDAMAERARLSPQQKLDIQRLLVSLARTDQRPK
jgi:mono/diheme cytochrome c family protein